MCLISVIVSWDTFSKFKANKALSIPGLIKGSVGGNSCFQSNIHGQLGEQTAKGLWKRIIALDRTKTRAWTIVRVTGLSLRQFLLCGEIWIYFKSQEAALLIISDELFVSTKYASVDANFPIKIFS